MRVLRPRLNAIELAMWGTLVAALAYLFGVARTEERLKAFLSRDNAEVQELAQIYGPSHYSEQVEEWILKDFFKDRRDGVFVEVGANHHQRSSNTYYLEHVMGWSGVAIEPQVKFAAGYREHRPKTTFVPLFVSDVSNREAILYVTEKNDSVASGVRQFTEAWGEITPTPATTSTLDDVLDALHIERIDFLSMDIELADRRHWQGSRLDGSTPASSQSKLILRCASKSSSTSSEISTSRSGDTGARTLTIFGLHRLDRRQAEVLPPQWSHIEYESPQAQPERHRVGDPCGANRGVVIHFFLQVRRRPDEDGVAAVYFPE